MSKRPSMKVLVGVYAAFCILVILIATELMKDRTVIYANVNTVDQKDVSFRRRIRELPENDERMLELRTEMNMGRILLPVHDGITENKIALLQDFATQSITVYIDTLSSGYYDSNRIVADAESVKRVTTCYSNGVTRLTIQLNGIYECTLSKENNQLTLNLAHPKDVHDRIILMAGGEDETGVVKKVLTKLSTLETPKTVGIFFYEDLINEELTDLNAVVQAIGADAVVLLGLAEDEDPAINGLTAQYNARFWQEGITGATLADALLRALCDSLYERGTKLEAAGEESFLYTMKVPSCVVNLGYRSNAQEMSLLRDEEYRNQIAETLVKVFAQLGAADGGIE